MSEFSIPHTLVTPAGNITFNPSGGGDGLYLSEIVGLDGGAIRNPIDDIPQADGSYLHPFFRSGLKATYRGFVLATAGVSTRRSMLDDLRGRTDRLLRPTVAERVSSTRMLFTPSGAAQRMLDDIQLFQPVAVTGGYLKDFEFTLASPFPYAMDFTQSSQAIAAGASATIANAGNTRSYPVIQVQGAFSTATIQNTTTGEKLVFTTGAAGGHYVEVDCFKRTAYLDGNGANELAALDWTQSTFFSLLTGNNTISCTGAGITILWNNAWAGS